MEPSRRGGYGTDFGLRLWEAWFRCERLSPAALERRLELSPELSMSASTIRRIRRGLASDNIVRFFFVAGINPVEGVHFEYGVPATKKLLESPSNPAIGAVAQFEALTRPERGLAAALTLFVGGWTEESGEGVFGPELWSVHKGLLDKGICKPAQKRYRLNEKFVDVASREASRQKVRDRFRPAYEKYFIDEVARRATQLYGPHERDAVSWFLGEHANVRSALGFARGSQEDWKNTVEAVAALYFRSELYEEGICALEELLEAWDSPEDPRFVRTMGAYAKCRARTLDLSNARRILKKTLRMAERTGEANIQIDCHSMLAGMPPSKNLGPFHPRMRTVGRARHQKIQDILASHDIAPDVRSRAHFNYALSEHDGKNAGFVMKQAKLSLAFSTEAKEPEMVASSLTLIAEVDHRECHFERAIAEYETAIEACKACGNALRLHSAVIRLGEAHMDSGDYPNALTNFRWAHTLSYLIQNDYYPVLTRLFIALANGLSSRQEEAKEAFVEAAESAVLHDYALPLERERYLSVACLIAEDPAVREEAFVGFRNDRQRWHPKSMSVRDEAVRAAAGICRSVYGRSRSMFDGLGYRQLFKNLDWLDKGGGECLRLLRASDSLPTP